MKIHCECGHVIYDQSDYLPSKAYLVADQDYFDLCEAIEEQITQAAADSGHAEQAREDARKALRRYARRAVFQCAACGRLWVEDAHSQSRAFAPTDAAAPKNLLRSVEGDGWKRNLRGHWNDRHGGRDKGELWWGFGGAEEGCERHDDPEEWARRYFEVFARLEAADLLRSAFLIRGAETLHEWP